MTETNWEMDIKNTLYKLDSFMNHQQQQLLHQIEQGHTQMYNI